MSNEVKELLNEVQWKVTRTARLESVMLDNGAVRFRVQVSDEGRKPFISRWFNDPVPASDFMERLTKPSFDPREDRVR